MKFSKKHLIGHNVKLEAIPPNHQRQSINIWNKWG